MNRIGRTLIAAAIALPSLAMAQESALPLAKTQGSVTYVTGGIGLDESTALRQEQKNYPLSLLFTEGKRGAYVANVHVTVKGAGGKVLVDSASSGPIMLVRLPPGEYRVSAELRGEAKQASVKVPETGTARYAFNWPSQEAY